MALAIRAENLSKAYQLGEFSTGTISRDIERWWYKVRGKDDPFLKVGETNDRTVKGNSDIVWSLKDINFEIQQGDAVGIIGRNGAGKSTLLKVLSRVTTPTTGGIKVKGRIASLLEVGTGFHPELTGRENIFLNGAILGMRKHEIKRKFDEIVDFAGVERYIDTPVKRYSSGMYVRLAFAVAAHLESEILIVDEVLAVGDSEFQKKCLGKMGEVSKGDGRTVLFVSHNMSSIKNLCNKGISLKNGCISNQGNIENVISSYLDEQKETSKLKIDDINRRIGKGGLRFTDLKFINDKGVETNSFQIGESIQIKISYKTEDDFNKRKTSRIDVGINDLYGNRVSWLSSQIYTDKLNVEDECINFYIKKLFLTEGIYNFNLFAQSNSGIEDWLQDVSKIEVLNSDFYGTGRNIPEKQGYFVTDFTL